VRSGAEKLDNTVQIKNLLVRSGKRLVILDHGFGKVDAEFFLGKEIDERSEIVFAAAAVKQIGNVLIKGVKRIQRIVTGYIVSENTHPSLPELLFQRIELLYKPFRVGRDEFNGRVFPEGYPIMNNLP